MTFLVERLEERRLLSAALSTTGFLQQAKLIAGDGAAGDEFGTSVAIDGNTAIIGAPQANGGQGVAYVFTESGSVWTEVAELTASSGTNVGLGTSVAINGNAVVVGAAGAAGGNGAAYVFTEPASGWANMTQTAELTAADGASGDLFGGSVAISAGTVVVGADDYTNRGNGAAYVFSEPATGWTDMTQTAELTPSDAAVFNLFGDSVAISGNTVAVGAYRVAVGGNLYDGAVYVFTEPGAGWANMTQTGELTYSGGSAGEELGQGVAISGNTVVGTASGAAYVFTEPAGGWGNLTQTAELFPSDESAAVGFGLSVAMSGNIVTVGAWSQGIQIGNISNATPGLVYVFIAPASGWANTTQTQILSASDGSGDDVFGQSVGISGDTILVGAGSATVDGNTDQGAAYVFGPTTPAFSNLSASSSIVQGIASVTFSGTITAGILIPPSSEFVDVTLNGVTQDAPIAASGNFTTTFNTSALPAALTPYQVTYAYAGDDSFSAVTDNTTTTLTVTGTASIAGTVYADTNDSGVLNANDPGLNDVMVYLDTNNNGQLDAGEISVNTDASGNYIFNDLSAGNYTVRGVVPGGYAATSPAVGYIDVTLTTGQAATGQTFLDAPTGNATAQVVYRLYSPVTLEHLYTTDPREYNTLESYVGTWNGEGAVFGEYSGPATVDGVTDEAFYRLYNPSVKQHLWTTDDNEYTTLATEGWTQEGIVGYVFPTVVPSVAPTALYRMMAPQVHLWTTNLNEYDTLQTEGWTGEGIIGYVL